MGTLCFKQNRNWHSFSPANTNRKQRKCTSAEMPELPMQSQD